MRVASILALFVLLAGVLACDGGSTSGSNRVEPSSFNSDSFAIADSEDAFANFEEATLDRDMAMTPVFHAGGEFDRHPMHPGGSGSHLAPILIRLGLDLDQVRQLRGIIADHRGTVREAFEGLRAVNMELIERANLERRSILASYAAGEITRDEAEQQLRSLNERTREAIRNNPANQEFLLRICDSRRELFGTIRSILSGPQVAEWDHWVAGLEGDCLNP